MSFRNQYEKFKLDDNKDLISNSSSDNFIIHLDCPFNAILSRNTWSWRGGRRNNYTNNTWNRWSYGGGGGRGRGSRGRGGRGRGGRGGGRRQPPPTREELDKELDSYMAGTKGLLDKEMDEYMANK